jgi:hypothetical protein
MVLGDVRSSSLVEKTAMVGRNLTYNPCAFFDNFTGYVSRESKMNGGAAFNPKSSIQKVDFDYKDSTQAHSKDRKISSKIR